MFASRGLVHSTMPLARVPIRALRRSSRLNVALSRQTLRIRSPPSRFRRLNRADLPISSRHMHAACSCPSSTEDFQTTVYISCATGQPHTQVDRGDEQVKDVISSKRNQVGVSREATAATVITAGQDFRIWPATIFLEIRGKVTGDSGNSRSRL